MVPRGVTRSDGDYARQMIDVVVIGAGQAGLAVSHELTALGVEHVVLERGRVGQTWRDRWDSFCLVTPNWTVRLPGGVYEGDDPDGFLPRDEIVGFLERYAGAFSAPVHEGVEVTGLEAAPRGGFSLSTGGGRVNARTVVLATGAYQRPHRPAGVTVPDGIVQIDTEGYRSPAGLPPGDVLVVGSGQTGCQIAEELHEAGRKVVLACGRAPWCSRRVGDRDVVWWALESGFLDMPVGSLPSPAARLTANIQATGHGGGHDLHYRVLQQQGVRLVGHLVWFEDGHARFAPDLAASVAFGDSRYHDFRGLIARTCADRGVPAPAMPDPAPFQAGAAESIDLVDVGAVIFTSGFRPDYSSWVNIDAFDDMGFPIHADGESSAAPGLFFCGVHFLRTRKSSLLVGVGEDAGIVAQGVARRQMA